MRLFFSLFVGLLVLAFSAGQAWALGMEDFGNKALSENNYGDWPGIMPLVNAESRIYHNWINGNEHFYYKGEIRSLNTALKEFSAVKTDARRVVLRLGLGEARTLDGKSIPCNWQLHVIGGIAGTLATHDKGELIWSKFPVLTVFVGDGIDLKQLLIPEGITLMSVADLKKRCTEALLKSSDTTVRGWGCGELASLDLYDDESVKTIVGRLEEEDSWVRQNAAGALAVFGAKAKVALDALRETAESEDQGLKEAAKKAIATIEAAVDKPDVERKHHAVMTEIEKFVEAHRNKSK